MCKGDCGPEEKARGELGVKASTWQALNSALRLSSHVNDLITHRYEQLLGPEFALGRRCDRQH